MRSMVDARTADPTTHFPEVSQDRPVRAAVNVWLRVGAHNARIEEGRDDPVPTDDR